MVALSPAAFKSLSQILKESFLNYEPILKSSKEIVNAPVVLACGA